jgi:type II secretory pathway component PulF
MNNGEAQFAIKKLISALSKPIAVILVFVALVLFLMKAISGITAR